MPNKHLSSFNSCVSSTEESLVWFRCHAQVKEIWWKPMENSKFQCGVHFRKKSQLFWIDGSNVLFWYLKPSNYFIVLIIFVVSFVHCLYLYIIIFFYFTLYRSLAKSIPCSIKSITRGGANVPMLRNLAQIYFIAAGIPEVSFLTKISK